GKPLQQVAVRCEDVDKAVAWPGVVVVLGRVLFGEGDVQVAADVVNSERGETSGDGGVGEAVDQVEVAIEYLDGAEAEVGGVEELAGRGAHQGESLVHRAGVASIVGDGGPVHGDDGVGGIDGGVPADDGAVLGGEQEPGGAGHAVLGYRETTRRWVEYRAVRRADGSGPSRRRRRDRHHELLLARAGLGVALPVIQGGYPGVVVGDPDRQSGPGGGAPGVTQVRVGVHGQARDVGDQVG